MVRHVEDEPGPGVSLALALIHHILAQRMGKAVEKAAALLAAVFIGPWVRLRDQMITACSDIVTRRAIQIEGKRIVVEARTTRRA